MKLEELQQHFFDAIFSKKISEKFLAEIKSTNNRTSNRALEIYRSSVSGNYVACLKRTYPVCLTLVGDEFFSALATYYVDITPSFSESLNDYGGQFSSFIKEFPHTQSMPYLADVAALEWLCHCVINAEDSPKLENEHWQALLMDEHLEDIIFCLPKSLELMQSDYPIQKIWHYHQADYIYDGEIDLKSGGDQLIISRHRQVIQLTKVSGEFWLLLQLIKQQKTFGEICVAFSEKNFNVVSLIPEAVKQQWVIGFTRQGR